MVITPIEIFGAIFSLICVWLTVKRNVWAWPIGLLGVSAYGIFFYDAKLYAEVGLQAVFFVQGVYGWFFWLFGKKEDVENVPIRRLSRKEYYLLIPLLVVLILSIGYLLDNYSDTDVPYIDTTLASISLIANLLLARKVIDNWGMWIFVDPLYVALFIFKGYYISAGLYLIFTFMAITGLIEWRKEWQSQKQKVKRMF